MSAHGSSSDRVSEASFYLLLTTSVLAPVLFGSTKPLVVDALCVMAAFTLLTAPTYSMTVKVSVVVCVATVVGMAYVFLCLVNARPWWLNDLDIRRLLPLLGPAYHPEGLEVEGATLGKEMLASGNAVLFVVCLVSGSLHGTIDGRTSTAYSYARVGALFYIAGSILLYAFVPGYVLWEEKKSYRDILTGTFINRNSAATFIGFCAIILYVSAIYKISRMIIFASRTDTFRVDTKSLAGRAASLDVAGFLLGVAALFMTGSRAGVISSVLTVCLITLVLLNSLFVGIRIPKRLLLVVFSLLALFALSLSGRFLLRLQQEGFMASPRLEAYRSMMPIISAYSLHGTGAGSFADVYPKYRPSSIAMNGVWDIAHSTPLEIMIEEGIPFALAVSLAYLAVFACLWRASMAISLAATTALGVWTLIGLHSLVDFSFQIPGVAAVAATLAGLALGQSSTSKAHR